MGSDWAALVKPGEEISEEEMENIRRSLGIKTAGINRLKIKVGEKRLCVTTKQAKRLYDLLETLFDNPTPTWWIRRGRHFRPMGLPDYPVCMSKTMVIIDVEKESNAGA